MSCPARILIRVVEHVRGTMSPLLGHLRCRRKSMPNPILVCLKAIGTGLKAKPKSFEEATNKELEAVFYVCLPQIRSLAECMLIG